MANATASNSTAAPLSAFELLATAAGYVAFGSVGCLANGLVLTLFARSPALRQQDGLYFMALLAACDLTNCVGAVNSGTYQTLSVVQEARFTDLTRLQCMPFAGLACGDRKSVV